MLASLASSSVGGDFLVLRRLEEDTELAVGLPISADTVLSLVLELGSLSLLLRVSLSLRGGGFLVLCRPEEETVLAAAFLIFAGISPLGLDLCLPSVPVSSSDISGFFLGRLKEETALAVGLLTSAGAVMFSLGLDFCLLTRASSSAGGGFLRCRLVFETELAVGLLGSE